MIIPDWRTKQNTPKLGVFALYAMAVEYPENIDVPELLHSIIVAQGLDICLYGKDSKKFLNLQLKS
jgi:hypothetical protein